jgi:transcriptional antiterminator RfaH
MRPISLAARNYALVLRFSDGGSAMSYWCVARSEPNREATAASFLGRSGYNVCLPRIRERRIDRGRRYVATPPLFPNYLFVRIELGWWSARWTCGVTALIMSGDEPAKVADVVIDGLRARERGGLIELEDKPRLRPGDPIKVTGGLLTSALGIYSGMRGADRVAVLLAALGVAVLPASDVEPAG